MSDKIIKISNHLKRLQIIGSNTNQNSLQQNIKKISVGSECMSVSTSCFYKCGNLTDVSLPNKCKFIGPYAFYECSSLTGINIFEYPKQKTMHIFGDYSFAKSGLKEVAIDLSGSTYDTFIGRYTFASCYNLKTVRMTRSSFFSDHMFDSCTSLNSVIIPEYTSFVYPGIFMRCTSLQKIDLPYKLWMMSDSMFEGCTDLTSVNIQNETTKKSILDKIGSRVFYGCNKLTSITLPESINDVTKIDDTFLSGSNIQKIIFKGMDESVFKKQSEEKVKIQYDYGKVYFYEGTDYVDKKWKETFTKSVNCNSSDPNKICQIAFEQNIPIVFMTSMLKRGSCSNCQSSIVNGWLTSDLAKKIKETNILFVCCGSEYIDNDYREKIAAAAKQSLATTYAQFFAYWKNPDTGKEIAKYEYFTSKKSTQIYNFIPEEFFDYTGTTPSIIENNQIGKFGSPLESVTMIDKQGGTHIIKNEKDIETYTIPEPDTTTTDNFQTGKWYYNAKQLKSYADKTHTPCFVEFSDKGCTPCQIFRSNVYNIKEFQEWVKKQPYLFCRIETETAQEFSDILKQPYFVRSVWCGDSTLAMPGMIYYWNKDDTTIIKNLSSYHPKNGDPYMTYQQIEDSISSNFK